MKRFKSRKKIKFLKLLLFIIIVFFSYVMTIKYLNNNIRLDPEKYIKSFINNGLNNQLRENKDKKENNINVVSLLENNLSFKLSNKSFEKKTVEYIEKVNKSMDNPLVYIYNSHDSEEYKLEYKYEYSIVPNVKLASYILQEKLESLGINSIVETTSIKDILNENGWVYRDSYRASRILLEKIKQENPSIIYFVDIHRDSSNYNKTTININDKVYARVLFVVGLEHENYQYNLDFSSKLNNIINSNYSNLSRGISKKEGLGVNGIYNQDFSTNAILVEIGGVDNTIDEISNTINILGESLYSYIKEDKNA